MATVMRRKRGRAKMYSKLKKTKIIILFTLIIIISILVTNETKAQPRNLSVEIFGPERFADIWLGISTGGYDVVAVRGKELNFRVFVKNGMADRSLHNLEIIPSDFPFEIESIRPRKIEQLKPMEIIIFRVNATIPEDAEIGRYRYTYDVKSDEFPTGVFQLNDEIKVVKRLNVELYAIYAITSIIILAILFYRKWEIAKQGKKKSKKK